MRKLGQWNRYTVTVTMPRGQKLQVDCRVYWGYPATGFEPREHDELDIEHVLVVEDDVVAINIDELLSELNVDYGYLDPLVWKELEKL